MQYAKIEAIYQEFANKFVEIIPVQWDRIVFFSEVEEGANSIHYVFYESTTKQVKEAETLTSEYGMNKKKRKLYSLDFSRLVTKLQNAFVEESLEKWNLVTFILESTGNFKLDFEYVDLELSNVITRRNEWEKKYL